MVGWDKVVIKIKESVVCTFWGTKKWIVSTTLLLKMIISDLYALRKKKWMDRTMLSLKFKDKWSVRTIWGTKILMVRTKLVYIVRV